MSKAVRFETGTSGATLIMCFESGVEQRWKACPLCDRRIEQHLCKGDWMGFCEWCAEWFF